ncbi:MAG: glycosyltransferase family 4 protein, partial [Methylococcales bacterium]
MSMKLGILCSHPIQYYAPIFRELAKRLDLQVFYAYRQTEAGQAEAGFHVPFEWDIDLLQGYPHKFLNNVAVKADPSRFFGCDTPDIANEIQIGRFDAFLVLGWGVKSYWQAVRACRRLNVPVMVRGDSRLGTSRSFIKRAIKKIIYPLVMRQFDACLYVGQDSKKYYQAYGVNSEKLFFSPHSVDNKRFSVEAEKTGKDEARALLGLEAGRQVVLFVGKFIPIKRPMDILQSALLLKQKNHPVHLLFAGDGPLRADIEAFAKTHDLNLSLIGFVNQSQLPVVYRAADLLVLPSETESWGLVANEAMACGLPVVVSNTVGCGPDLICKGKTGSVFEMGNIAALSEAIHEVMQLMPAASEIQYHIADYSPEKTTKGIMEAMQWLSEKENKIADKQ